MSTCGGLRLMRGGVLGLNAEGSEPKTLLRMCFNPLHGGVHKILRTKSISSPPTIQLKKDIRQVQTLLNVQTAWAFLGFADLKFTSVVEIANKFGEILKI